MNDENQIPVIESTGAPSSPRRRGLSTRAIVLIVIASVLAVLLLIGTVAAIGAFIFAMFGNVKASASYTLAYEHLVETVGLDPETDTIVMSNFSIDFGASGEAEYGFVVNGEAAYTVFCRKMNGVWRVVSIKKRGIGIS